MNKHTVYDFFNKNRTRENDHLPKNRFRAYFDTVKLRFGILVLNSLLSSIFFIPLFAFLFLSQLYINLPVTDITGQYELAFRMFSLKTIESLISVPLFVLGFAGLGGSFNIVRKLVFQEPDINVARDFFHGVKANVKESLLSGFLFGFYMLILTANIYFYPTIEGFPNYASIGLTVVLTLFFVYVMGIIMFLMAGSSIYSFRFFNSLKNASTLALILFLKNIVFIVLGAVSFLCYLLIPYVLVQMIMAVVIVVFGFSHMTLVFTLYGFHIFDKHINTQYEPGIVGRGLDKKED